MKNTMDHGALETARQKKYHDKGRRCIDGNIVLKQKIQPGDAERQKGTQAYTLNRCNSMGKDAGEEDVGDDHVHEKDAKGRNRIQHVISSVNTQTRICERLLVYGMQSEFWFDR